MIALAIDSLIFVQTVPQTFSLPIQTNTFQCVLGTDHNSSFVMLFYEEGGIQWAAGQPYSASSMTGRLLHTIMQSLWIYIKPPHIWHVELCWV